MIEKRKTSLHELLEIEDWLASMAKEGYELTQVTEDNFEFQEKIPAKTKHKHYAFFYYWKGKKERPMSVEDAAHFGKVKIVPTYRLRVGILTDVTIGLYVLETKDDQIINKFYEYHHINHSKAVRHSRFYRCLICGLIILACLVVACLC